MPYLVVCSLSHLHATVQEHDIGEMVTLLASDGQFERPAAVDPERHLFLNMNDISVQIDGMRSPEEGHIARLIDFAGSWDRSRPLLIHCWMGVSRSTAAAYITALALDPSLDEDSLAAELRRRSPSATPNPRLIALADDFLGRGGRMITAIDGIGRGAETSIGSPFVLPLGVT